MKSEKIILLGDPRLHEVSAQIEPSEIPDLMPVIQDLHDILFEYKARFAHYGAFRGIAAPQIGVMKRLIYMNIDNKATVFINPELINLSEEMFEVWDDCMCFPNLLVRLNRHFSCSIKYVGLDFQPQILHLEGPLSELIQHEFDHLNGILSTQKAIDNQSFRWRK
jgi:peptide deformylase